MKKHSFLSVFLSLVLVLSTVFTGNAFAAPDNSGGKTIRSASYAFIYLFASTTLVGCTGSEYNPPDISGKYYLILEGLDNAPMPGESFGGTVTVKNPNGEGSRVLFDDAIIYDTPGTYNYKVTQRGNVPGVNCDQTDYYVQVTVTDNNGILTATITDGNQVTKFTNTYSVSPAVLGEGQISVNKALTGKNLTADAFSFNIKASNDTPSAPLPAVTTAKNDADGKVNFGEITYNNPGTYKYEISEVNDGQSGYTYDDKTVCVTVTVSDNSKGQLIASVAYKDNDNSFTNEYTANGSIQIFAKKNLTGRALENGQFTFNLIDKDNNVLRMATNDENGDITFDTLNYTQNDVGTFYYSIVEVNDGKRGYTYDEHTETVEVTVTDNGDGTLSTTAKYYDLVTGNEHDQAVFNNTYEPSSTEVLLTAKKILTGRTLVDGEFSFTISEGVTVFATGKNDANGNIKFSAIPITNPGTYKFTAAEVIGSMEGITYDTTPYTYVVVVEDIDGILTVKDVSIEGANEAVFTNTYKTTPQPDNPDNPKTPDTPDNPKTPDNTKTPDTPGIHKILNTGDNTNFILWLSLMCLSATGFTSVILFGRRKRSYKYERK